jgi:hypothetical protein
MNMTFKYFDRNMITKSFIRIRGNRLSSKVLFLNIDKRIEEGFF